MRGGNMVGGEVFAGERGARNVLRRRPPGELPGNYGVALG